ncbi:MAG: multicopper oxidase domain-containing protein [Planctomycetes bacterium]|nr:multicopper oxidase domain-containing protein [Planctomycetota bacterium]
MNSVTRRDLIKAGTLAAATAGAAALGARSVLGAGSPASSEPSPVPVGATGEGLKLPPYQMDPGKFLSHFDYGKVVEERPNGTSVREYELIAEDKEILVAPGVYYPAWVFNGTVPGPTLRCREGDLLRVTFRNASKHDHTIHFHGIHPANMDGVYEIVPTGGSYTYEYVAEPFGLFLYHCHVMPLRKHISKGLYGAFIVDPPEPREAAREMVMVMNGFDVDFDGENEFYTVNGVANYYLQPGREVKLKTGELVRVYLANLTEFDLINSFHIHANVFRLYRTGTRLDQYEVTDTVMLCQGERSVLEFSYKYPGKYLFHAHQSEFAELGWSGIFEVSAHG